MEKVLAVIAYDPAGNPVSVASGVGFEMSVDVTLKRSSRVTPSAGPIPLGLAGPEAPVWPLSAFWADLLIFFWVTAPFLSYFVPTLFLGSLRAAYEMPPRARKTAMVAMTFA